MWAPVQVANWFPASPAKAKFTSQLPGLFGSAAALIPPASSCLPVNCAGNVGSMVAFSCGTGRQVPLGSVGHVAEPEASPYWAGGSSTNESDPVWPTRFRICVGSVAPGTWTSTSLVPTVSTIGSETPSEFTRFSMMERITSIWAEVGSCSPGGVTVPYLISNPPWRSSPSFVWSGWPSPPSTLLRTTNRAPLPRPCGPGMKSM